MQMNWHVLMEPAVSMLKFRLPYLAPGSIEKKLYSYLKGEVYIQPWAPHTSTETRLMVFGTDKSAVVDYDCKTHESQMFYHNMIVRNFGVFKHNVHGEGIDNCWDCRAEIEIITEYLNSDFYKLGSYKDYDLPRDKLISKISYDMSKLISQRLTLINPPHGTIIDPNADILEVVAAKMKKYFPLMIAQARTKVQWKEKVVAESKRDFLLHEEKEKLNKQSEEK